MPEPLPDFARDVLVVNELGLHARSAARIAKVAAKASKPVWLIRDGHRVEATSIIEVLTLACVKGTRLTVHIEDAADLPILEEMAALFADGFGE